jgi:hypothetical protein
MHAHPNFCEVMLPEAMNLVESGIGENKAAGTRKINACLQTVARPCANSRQCALTRSQLAVLKHRKSCSDLLTSQLIADNSPGEKDWTTVQAKITGQQSSLTRLDCCLYQSSDVGMCKKQPETWTPLTTGAQMTHAQHLRDNHTDFQHVVPARTP